VRPASGLVAEHRQALRPRHECGGVACPPRYGACLVDAYRDLVRKWLAEKTPVTRMLAEIREQGYTGSANLLVRYLNQGEPVPSAHHPRHAASSPGS
jgi:hypothetical protein